MSKLGIESCVSTEDGEGVLCAIDDGDTVKITITYHSGQIGLRISPERARMITRAINTYADAAEE
jgi:hypothetical protein